MFGIYALGAVVLTVLYRLVLGVRVRHEMA
jgi:hypothetical protein